MKRAKGKAAAKPGIRRKTGRATSTSWKPGQSGNPNGRPKLSPEQRAARAQAQAILDAATPDAALVHVEMLAHSDFRARHVAATSILDRGNIDGVVRIEAPPESEGQRDFSRLNDAEFGMLQALTGKLHGQPSTALTPHLTAMLAELGGAAPDFASAARILKRLADVGAKPMTAGVVDAELVPLEKMKARR